MTLAAVPSALPDVPPMVRDWIAQLLEPEMLDLLRHAGNRQVDVRLSSNGGEVRRRPVVTIGGRAGPRDCET